MKGTLAWVTEYNSTVALHTLVEVVNFFQESHSFPHHLHHQMRSGARLKGSLLAAGLPPRKASPTSAGRTAEPREGWLQFSGPGSSWYRRKVPSVSKASSRVNWKKRLVAENIFSRNRNSGSPILLQGCWGFRAPASP